ncbi:MAG: hypothetical protein IIX39_06980 [Clostridia bacterium]|nr:hypothetical protein [Clostridia bacterium]
MIEEDTIKLLKECDSGIKMGVKSIDDMIGYVKDEKMKNILKDSRDDHIKIKDNLQDMLEEYHDDGKEPNAMAKSMSWMKTNMKLMINESDNTVADLTVDGCDMGVKSLSKYLNKYKAADEKSKDIAKKLIKIEADLSVSMRDYL